MVPEYVLISSAERPWWSPTPPLPLSTLTGDDCQLLSSYLKLCRAKETASLASCRDTYIFALTSPHHSPLCRLLSSLQAAAPGLRAEALILPDGEQHKNLDVVSQVWTRALELRLDRKTTFIALGGGVIGDMTGYAAAAYQRGVNFIQACLHACGARPLAGLAGNP